jgi:hypothetical protein
MLDLTEEELSTVVGGDGTTLSTPQAPARPHTATAPSHHAHRRHNDCGCDGYDGSGDSYYDEEIHGIIYIN